MLQNDVSGISDGSLTVDTLKYWLSDSPNRFVQSGGSVTVNSELDIDGSGYYEMSGDSTLIVQSEMMNGTFAQTGGVHVIDWMMSLYGTYGLGGGRFTASGGLNLNGTAHFEQTAGTFTTASVGIPNANTTYDFTGGTMIVMESLNGGGSLNFGGGLMRIGDDFSATSLAMTLTGVGGDANLDTDGHDVTFDGSMSGVGGLNKLGDGTLTLAGLNTYTGDTTVTDGAVTLAEAGSLLLDINNPMDDYSQIIGTGTLDLEGTINLDLSDVSVSTGSWLLIDPMLATTYGSSFAMDVLGGGSFTGSGGVWSYGDGLGRTWTFDEGTGTLTAVPEPSTFVMLAAALAGLLMCARRKR